MRLGKGWCAGAKNAAAVIIWAVLAVLAMGTSSCASLRGFDTDACWVAAQGKPEVVSHPIWNRLRPMKRT
jgi:hypothetical protein